MLLIATQCDEPRDEPPLYPPPSENGKGTPENPIQVGPFAFGFTIYPDDDLTPFYFVHEEHTPDSLYWYVLFTSSPKNYQLTVAQGLFSETPMLVCSVSGTKPLMYLIQCPATSNEFGELYSEIQPLDIGGDDVKLFVSEIPYDTGWAYSPLGLGSEDLPALGVVNGSVPSYYAVTTLQNYSLQSVTLSGLTETVRLSLAFQQFSKAPVEACVIEGTGILSCNIDMPNYIWIYVKVELLSGLQQFFTLDRALVP